jgi:hypothetical protein
MNDLPLATQAHTYAQQPQPATEQEVIRRLHAAIRRVIELYGSQKTAAPALGVSASWLTRISFGWLTNYSSHHRLPRPHTRTLLRLSKSHHACVQTLALILLDRRGGPSPTIAP